MLIKIVSCFVESEKLQEYVDRRPAKRPKVSSSTCASAGVAGAAVVDLFDDDDDEFDTGIDFEAIEMPLQEPSNFHNNKSRQQTGLKIPGKKSPYFGS